MTKTVKIYLQYNPRNLSEKNVLVVLELFMCQPKKAKSSNHEYNRIGGWTIRIVQKAKKILKYLLMLKFVFNSFDIVKWRIWKFWAGVCGAIFDPFTGKVICNTVVKN